MNKVLFIGNFLSKSRGTISPSEKIARALVDSDFIVLQASAYDDKLLRFLHILYSAVLLRYEVMHLDIFSGQYFHIAEMASRIASLRGKKMIMTLHGGKLPEFFDHYPRRINRVFSRAHIITSPSLMLGQFFKDKGFEIKYIPNAIDLKRFTFGNTSHPRRNILWVRAFSPIYQPEMAVKVLYEVRKFYPDITLTMVGPDKGIQHKCMSLANVMGVEPFIHWIGKVPNEQLQEYYQTHEVLLNTTKYESFGMAVLEAASCGIPVVSTPAGEIPLLWKNEEEILITPDWSPESMAKAVIKVLEDKTLANKLSLNARKKAEQFDWGNIKKLWMDIFNHVV